METQSVNFLERLLDFGPILIGLLGVGTAIYTALITQHNKKVDEERGQILKQLNEFYAPFEQLRGKSKRLYILFRRTKGNNFQTLSALLNGEEFSNNDTQLLKEIISIDKQLERLVLEKSGLVDKPEIRELLTTAVTHFHLINAAFEGSIKGEPERFREFTFPEELDEKILTEITYLKERLRKLDKRQVFHHRR